MYKAYLNNQIFFDTDSDDYSLILTEAKLTLKAGTSGSFVFTIPPQNTAYGTFHKLIDYVDVYRDDDLIFSGRVYSVEMIFDTQYKITCEGLLAILNDSIFRPITFDGYLHTLVQDIITSHNSQVEQDKQITVGNLLISDEAVYRAYENYETSISRLHDLVDTFGGWIRIRKTNGTLYFDWYDDFIDGTSQLIDFGENLLDITQSHTSNGIITVLIPLGKADNDGNRLTISSVNAGLDYLDAPAEYIQQYGYIVGTNIWQDVDNATILKRRGQEWLTASLTPKTTIKVTAVDLADAGFNVDSFAVGQKIKVISAPHNLNGEWFKCQEQNLDLLNPANNKLSLGTEVVGYTKTARSMSSEIRSSIERIVKTYTPRSALQDAIDTATSLITGNSGGYIVLHDSDEDGEPDELLVMDTPDIETAVKVWRFNNSGLGYSSTGYSGTYGLAMTMDGAIVADRITTGTLNGNLIRAGVIRGQQGNTYWDLDSGVLHIEGSGDVDKSKVFIYEPVPPYYVGDLWCTQRSETSGVVGYAIAGYAIVGDDSDGEGGKIMACIYTRTSGSFNPDDWTLITNYIDDSDLQILQQRISSAELNISANTAEIQTKASVEIVDDLGNQLALAQTEIDQNAYDITLKVSNTDYNGESIISKINLNATAATIDASQINLQGAVTISSFDATTQGKVVIGSTSKNQYYLSTSSSSATGGSWSDSISTWTNGRYVWTRIATVKTYADNTTATSYSNGVYDSNLTTALSTATSANSTARGALASTVSCYYRSTSSTAPTISTSASIGTADNTDDAWEYVLPKPKNARYFYTCERYTDKAGNVTFSAVRQMSNLTVASLWCSANDSTYIDGGHIYASSVTATQIASSAITADKISVGAVTNAKLGDGSVTSGKIGSGAIIETKLADNAVTTNKINASAVTNAKLADGAVTAGKIGSGAVTEVKLSNGAVTVDKIGSGAVTTVKLADGSVTTAKVPSYAITGVKIANNAIEARCIAANAVTANAIAANAVTADKINVADLFSQNITASNFNITGGSINVTTTSASWSFISLNYGSYYSRMAAEGLNLTDGTYASWFWAKSAGHSTGGVIRVEQGIDSAGSSYFTLRNKNDKLNMYARTGDTSYAGLLTLYDSTGDWTVSFDGSNGYVYCYYCSEYSDERLKRNIKPLELKDSAKFIYSLNPVSYQYNNSDAIHHGFIAQDVEKAVYDKGWGIVTTPADDSSTRKVQYKALSYTEIIGDLVATVQSLNDRITTLEKGVK